MPQHLEAKISMKQPREAAPIGAATVSVPILWTPRETADYLGISEKKLERDRWLGPSIPFVKLGRHVRYRALDVVEHVERNLVAAKCEGE